MAGPLAGNRYFFRIGGAGIIRDIQYSLHISAAGLSGKNKFYLYIVSALLLQEHEYPFENTPAEINW